MSKNDCKCDNHSFEELHIYVPCICVHMKNILFMINFILYVLKFGNFHSLHDVSCINEYLAIYSGGHVSE